MTAKQNRIIRPKPERNQLKINNSNFMKHQAMDENVVPHERLENIGESKQNPLFTPRMTDVKNNLVPNRPELTRIGHDGETASSATRKCPVHKFKYEGRWWKIQKRSVDADASWYLYFEENKQRYSKTLKTSSKGAAEAEAKAHIDRHIADRRKLLRGDVVSAANKNFCKLADIIGRAGSEDFGVVLMVPTKKNAGEKARKSYAWSLRWCLRLALGITSAAMDELPASILSLSTAEKFFNAALAESRSIASQADRNTYLRNAYGFFNNARALFADRPLHAMRTTFQLTLPDDGEILKFRTAAKKFAENVPRAPKGVLPGDDIIFQTIREWNKMGRTPGYQIPGGDRTRSLRTATGTLSPMSEQDRRNLFISIGLILSCGLRVSETRRVAGKWVQQRNHGPLLEDVDTAAKDRTGIISVTPVDPFWRMLWRGVARNNWAVGPDELLLTARDGEWGEATDRGWWPETHGSNWLRWLGWETKKTNHALRDFVASQITMRYGLGSAKDFCRHKTQSTTENNYNRFVEAAKRVDARKLAYIRWAR